MGMMPVSVQINPHIPHGMSGMQLREIYMYLTMKAMLSFMRMLLVDFHLT